MVVLEYRKPELNESLTVISFSKQKLINHYKKHKKFKEIKEIIQGLDSNDMEYLAEITNNITNNKAVISSMASYFEQVFCPKEIV